MREAKRDDLANLAAALSYYAMLSIFPMLLAIVSVLGVIGDGATQPLLDNLRELSPGPARDVVTGAVENLRANQGSAGLLLVVGVAAALWSASRYVAAFMRAANVIYEVDEGRPLWTKLPVRLGITVAVALALVASALAVTVTGDLARQAGQLLGLGSTAVTVWDLARWPAALVVVTLLYLLLYWAAPNVRHPGWQWLLPGAVLAVVMWIVASVAFTLYVANFGSYNPTYGSLGGAVVFLVWLWITNGAVLLGAEFASEVERARRIEAGSPADQEPFLPHRDVRRLGHGP